jgi:hypothetical protein
VVPASQKVATGRLQVQGHLGKVNGTLSWNQWEEIGDVAQVVEYLLSVPEPWVQSPVVPNSKKDVILA